LIPIFIGKFDVIVDSGHIQLILRFEGPHGAAFPRLHSSTTPVDDVYYSATKDKSSQQLAQDIILQADSMVKPDSNCEFTEDDIRSTFEHLDLDKNGYIGAAEIRHILICMGELVTDEEIDMMIHMLDSSGDGQVSLQQFKAMIESSDPATDDFQHSIEDSEFNVEDFEQKKEIERREIKRKVISDFVLSNKIRKEDIFLMRDHFLERVDSQKSLEGNDDSLHPWNIDFECLCKILPIEATGQTKKLFSLIAINRSDVIDIRELILSLSNFIKPYSVEERCQVMFALFDLEKDGSLSLCEMESILIGNHLMSRKAITKKAQTIMKYLETDASGQITPQELLLASTKFPNLIFPKHL